MYECCQYFIYFLHFLFQPFVSIDSDVLWPKWSSFDAELGPAGETIIRSEEGRAALMLSASGDTFSVEFTSSLSQTQRRSMQGFSRDSDSSPGNHPQQQQISNLICQTSNVENKQVHQGIGSRRNESIRSRSCSPRTLSTAQPTVMPLSNILLLIYHRFDFIFDFPSPARGDVSIHHSGTASLLLRCCPTLVLPSVLGSASLDYSSL